jgi:hypothetical protein
MKKGMSATFFIINLPLFRTCFYEIFDALCAFYRVHDRDYGFSRSGQTV